MIWDPRDIPDQSGRTVVVTGPTVGGLGYHTALELARNGARVVLAGRNKEKRKQAAAAISEELPAAQVETLPLDLARMESVRHAASAARDLGPIHLLVNNAGVMGTPLRRTVDGLELQMQTNHFAPFLLTGLLLPQLVESGEGRVVTVSSLFHRYAGHQPVDDPREAEGRYHPWRVYGRSKLANLHFTSELERRLSARGLPVKALAAHPGFAGTHLAVNGQYGVAGSGADLGSAQARRLDRMIGLVSQSAAAGARPTLMAATADLDGDTFVGPTNFLQMQGPPKVVGRSRLARDRSAGQRLWEISEGVVGMSYP
ncbi:SDR family NAD(P)-dependent oxidoreductase [Nocardioides sp. GY 10113]|uniref:oxidoreductase n=1 Tax=Nocardioides sp. GY 10113 TaxID=2569761 RepID=UPI0010A79773|nr:oxidoreductase [Nocardioides sp. GY 10113]TIC83602.1 SDR family NAD(P)-dependent oxidoreductase [Nocardioides sp. GY 10113]